MAKKIGRRKGSRTKGYYYRKGRGWYAKDGTRNVPLVYPSGEHIRDRDVDPEAIKEAFERWKTATQIVKENARKADARDATITLERVCDLYLSHVQMTGSEATHYSRANTLFDLCYGIPAKFRRKKGESTEFTTEEKRAMQKERCEHPPYGNLPAIALTPLHVDEWFKAHPTWEKSRRTRVQALAASPAAPRLTMTASTLRVWSVTYRGAATREATGLRPDDERSPNRRPSNQGATRNGNLSPK